MHSCYLRKVTYEDRVSVIKFDYLAENIYNSFTRLGKDHQTLTKIQEETVDFNSIFIYFISGFEMLDLNELTIYNTPVSQTLWDPHLTGKIRPKFVPVGESHQMSSPLGKIEYYYPDCKVGITKGNNRK